MDVRVKEARIKNFRSIVDLKLPLLPGINLLVGPNSAGKSNILLALAEIYGKYKIEKAYDYSSLSSNAPELRASGLLSNSINKKDLLNKSFYMSPVRDYRQHSPVVTQLHDLSANGNNFTGALCYYRTSVEEPDDLKMFADRVKKIIPEVENVTAPFHDSQTARLVITVMRHGKKIETTAENAATGTLDAIFLVFLLQILSEGSVYFLDSPENHLHAGSQEAMLDLIREVSENSSKQFVIATHSKTLVNMCSAEEIVLVTKDDFQTKAEKMSDVKEIMEILNTSDARNSDITSSLKPV